MKKKFLSLALASALVLGTLTACGADNSQSSTTEKKTATTTSTTTATETAKEKTTLRILGFNSVIGHIDSVVAYTGGFYDEEGINPEFTFNNSNPDNTQALLEDKADLVSAGATCVIQYIDQGADLVIIGGQMSLGETVYALPERADEFKEFTTETLAGKKIGVSRLNTGDIAFRKILKDKGVDLSQIEFVELDSQATVTQAVVKGEVDLGINFLTFRKSAEDLGLVAVSQLDAEDEWPDYICCRIFTTRDKLNANRQVYVDAIKANIKAYELIQTDHAKAIEVAQKGIQLDADVLEDQIYNYGHLGLSPNPDVKNSVKFYEAMTDVGYAEGTVDLHDYIDASVYVDALNELLAEDPTNAVYLELKAESDATNQ